MDVVYFGSREIYGDFRTAVRSLLAHNPDARVWTLTEDPDPFYDLPVNNIVWRWQDYFNTTNTQTKWRQFGPVRAAFTKVFPMKRVISLDVDTIVLDDISELWTMDMQGCHVAMCREEYMSRATGRPYYNNGICVMDLQRIREDGLDDAMIRDLNTTAYRYVGQDVMQRHLKILDLDTAYNQSKFTKVSPQPKILHFADRTDWRQLPEVAAYR